jgi:hypothetical protein
VVAVDQDEVMVEQVVTVVQAVPVVPALLVQQQQLT